MDPDRSLLTAAGDVSCHLGQALDSPPEVAARLTITGASKASHRLERGVMMRTAIQRRRRGALVGLSVVRCA